MSVLGINLNLSGKDAGYTRVSNTYLCQVYDAVEYVRDNLQSALSLHINCTKCDSAMYVTDRCDMARIIIDSFEELNDYLIDDDGKDES